MTIKRKTFCLIALCSVLAFTKFNVSADTAATGTDAAAPGDFSVTETIKSFDDILKVQNDGSVNVQEKIVYDFGSNSKHGIYRNIPVIFSTDLGKLSTKIGNVSVSDENGQPYKFTTYGSGNDYVIKIGDPNVTVTGAKTYVLGYTISRVVNFFSDHDELYWNATGNEWEVPINESSVEISLPGQAAAGKLTVKCYAGALGSTASCDNSAAKDSGASFGQGSLAAGEGLTIVVGFPKGLVMPPTTWQKILQIVSDNWIVAVPFFVFILMFLLWRSKGRDPEVNDPIVAEYEAPGGLSPAECLELLKFSEPSRGVSAEIIWLAVGGYLKINKKDDDYEFVRLKPSDSLTKVFDKTLLDGLFSQSLRDFLPPFVQAITGAQPKQVEKSPDTILLSDKKNVFYQVLARIKTQITKALVDQSLFAKDPNMARLPFVIVGFLVGIFGTFYGAASYGAIGAVSMLATAVIVIAFGMFMPKRTLAGAKMAKQVLGLKLYLNVAEKDRLEFHDAPEKTPERFEKLLPYAIALGVENQWAKQFEGIYNQPPTWYNDHYNTFTTLALVNSLNHFHSASSTALSSTPRSSASSGGSGFGGGFSGGGFGGGGGGSW